MTFRAEKTMNRPPGDVSQAARILGKNNVWLCRLANLTSARLGARGLTGNCLFPVHVLCLLRAQVAILPTKLAKMPTKMAVVPLIDAKVGVPSAMMTLE